MRDPLYNHGPNYKTDVEPLLNNLMNTFQHLSTRWTSLTIAITSQVKSVRSSRLSPSSSSSSSDKDDGLPVRPESAVVTRDGKAKKIFFSNPRSGSITLILDIQQASNMTALRATEIYGLYQYVYGSSFHTVRKNETFLKQQLFTAEAAITQALQVVNLHSHNYPLGIERVASWRPMNPTAYRYGYLWTAQSLYYFWRDYSIATNTSVPVQFPCFMNVINPADIGFGTGLLFNFTLELQDYLEQHGHDLLAECLTPPSSPPYYPLTPFPFTLPSSSSHPFESHVPRRKP